MDDEEPDPRPFFVYQKPPEKLVMLHHIYLDHIVLKPYSSLSLSSMDDWDLRSLFVY